MPEPLINVSFESLVGEHVLTGVDFGALPPNHEAYRYDDAATMTFVLDGHAYCAIEDPSDGYRSCLNRLIVAPGSVANTFPPCRVLARMRTRGNYGAVDDVLECLDIVTGKVVLEVGTGNVDDYYPCFVANFLPQHMAINQADAPTEPRADPHTET